MAKRSFYYRFHYSWGSKEDDTIIGTGGRDFIYGADGDDIIDGGAGNDYLYGGNGNDTIYGGSGRDFLIGGAGDDTLDGGSGNDYLFGGSGNDTLIGGSGRDYLSGGSGDDTLDGGTGRDYLFGGSGNDTLDGGDGNDYLWGHSGNDHLTGGAGRDYLSAGSGDDTLEGGTGRDYLFGGRGNDRLDGGADRDYLYGGHGDDNLNGGTGHDHLNTGHGNDIASGGDGNDFIWSYGGNNTLSGDGGNDRIYAYYPGQNTVSGGAGNDYILTGQGDDNLAGDSGNDFIYSFGGNNIIDAGSGSDRVYSGRGDDEFSHDVMLNQHARDFYYAGAGHDSLNFLVDVSVASQDWYQQAVNDFQDFLSSHQSQYAYFDFRVYDPSGEFLQLRVAGFEEFSQEVSGETDVPPQNISLSNDNIDENSAAGTVVGVISSDNEQGQTASYSLSNNADGRFVIDANSGEISLASNVNLDFESTEHYDIVVVADDGHGNQTSQQFTINVNDLNEAPIEIILSNNAIIENATAGSVVGTVSSQNDAGESASYHLLDDAGGRFQINQQTGNITVAADADLDFESADSHSITVRVDDGNGHQVDTQFIIAVEDANEIPRNISLSNNAVNETASNGQLVGVVGSINDAGETPSYSLINDANGAFTINSQTGAISVADSSLLDYETASELAVTVAVNDGTGNITNQTFNIQLIDQNETPWNIALSNNNIVENANLGATVGVVSSDNDAGETPHYSLVDDAGGLFSIDATTGEITVAGNLDFETASAHQIVVRTDDGTGNVIDENFTINVTDIPENESNAQFSGLLNGAGQTVAVIDTGLAWNMSAFGGGFGEGHRVVGGWDFAENDANPFDDPGGYHGTHVTSIIASEGEKQIGWAPDADIVALRVFADNGSGYFSWVESALQWVLQNKDSFEHSITTVNLSLGVNGFHSNTLPAWAMLEDEFAALEDAGIFIAVSAGNSFSGHSSQGLSYPAISPHVTPVASHGNSNQLSSFSQRNSDVIVANGESVEAYVPNHVFNTGQEETGYLSGTSMASPQVAGASIVLRELMQIVGIENVDQDAIYQHIRDTADMIYDNITNTHYHKLNLNNAIEALIPDDEYGDNLAAAYDLGALSNGASISGFIEAYFTHDANHNGRITDISGYDVDYFSFTATATDTIHFTALTSGVTAIDASWITSNINGATVNGQSLSFNVVAGQQYDFGLSSSDGMGFYNLYANYGAAPDVVNNPANTIDNSTQPLNLSEILNEANTITEEMDVALELNITDDNLQQNSNSEGDYML